MKQALQPGSASYDNSPAHFSAIASGAGSCHALVRMDIAGALGDSDLGERNRARAVPILVGMLDDASSKFGASPCSPSAGAAAMRKRKSLAFAP